MLRSSALHDFSGGITRPHEQAASNVATCESPLHTLQVSPRVIALVEDIAVGGRIVPAHEHPGMARADHLQEHHVDGRRWKSMIQIAQDAFAQR